MKCEIKYIEHKAKKDYKAFTVGGFITVILISIAVSFALSLFLDSTAVNYLLVLSFALLMCCMWKDAVDYCKNRKIINGNILH